MCLLLCWMTACVDASLPESAAAPIGHSRWCWHDARYECKGWWGKVQPIMMLIEESRGVDELMRHVDTGWASQSKRFKSSSAAGNLWQTAGHQSHKRQIVAVTSSLMHGSSESLCWVIQHVVTSLSDCFSCLENQNIDSKMMFRLCSNIFEHGNFSLKYYLWGEKNSMPIIQNHPLEYNHFYHFWAVMWRVCIIFSADLRLLLCADGTVFHNRLLTSLIFNNKVCCLCCFSLYLPPTVSEGERSYQC